MPRSSSPSPSSAPPALPLDYTRSALARLRYHSALAESHRSGTRSLNVRLADDGTGASGTDPAKATPTKAGSASTGPLGERGREGRA